VVEHPVQNVECELIVPLHPPDQFASSFGGGSREGALQAKSELEGVQCVGLRRDASSFAK
jgi:hypothetical protein